MELVEVLEDFWDSRLEEIHTAFPAIVQSYSGHKTRLVTVVPATNLMLSNGAILPTVPISGIPVLFPSSQAGGFVFPLKEGDTVMVIVSETAMGNWIAGDGNVCDPEHASRFNAGDGVAIPGLWTTGSKKKPRVTVPDTSAEVNFNGASVEFKKDGSLKFTGDVEIVGKLKTSGDIQTSADVYAMVTPTTAVSLATHMHATVGAPPTVGTPPTP